MYGLLGFERLTLMIQNEMKAICGMPVRVCLSDRSGSNFAQRAWWKFGESSKNGWYGGGQVFHVVAASKDDKNCNRQCYQVLLILHTLVSREQDIEFTSSQSEQLAVLDAGLAHPITYKSKTP